MLTEIAPGDAPGVLPATRKLNERGTRVVCDTASGVACARWLPWMGEALVNAALFAAASDLRSASPVLSAAGATSVG